MSLLKVENLSTYFSLQNKTIEAVKDVSFEIEKGETFALVGESGAGKSVTAYSILKLLPYPQAYHPGGKIFFNGSNLLELNDPEIRDVRGRDISMIFQEPMTSLNPLHRIERQIGESLILHKRMSESDARKKISELLELVQLKDAKNRLNAFPHELSGGERQRVMIAMSIANEPKLLIADEPTTALDVTIQAEILKLLNDLKKRLNMSLLIITHDLTIVQKIADKICIMKDGIIVERGLVSEIFDNPRNEYTKILFNSLPKGNRYGEIVGQDTLLETKDLYVKYVLIKNFFGKPVKVLNAVDKASIKVNKGETLGIVGESGSGKSSLAMAVLRLIKSEGKISFNDKNLNELKSKDMRPLRNQIQVIFQDPFGSLNPRMNILQIVGEGLKIHRQSMSEYDRKKAVIDILSDVGLSEDILDNYPHEFSGGQRQRIAIARALVLKPKLVILDEPTSSLDMTIQFQILELLKSLQKKYDLTYMFISHDLRVIRSICHRIIIMKDGKIIEEGITGDIFENPKNIYVKKLIDAAFEIKVVE